MYLLYNIFSIVLFLVALPFLLVFIGITGKYRRSIAQKLGFLSRDTVKRLAGQPRIWINAVSVGEIVAVSPIVRALKRKFPSAPIVLSTGTESGRVLAEKIVKDVNALIYFPLDFLWAVRRFLKLINPELFITTEAEIWPNLLHTAKKLGVKTMLANGRISQRSIGKYKKARFFFKRILEDLDVMSMISQVDADRIISIGAHPEKVTVSGNTKYDSLSDETNPDHETQMREMFGIAKDDLVFVAGSTHEGEEEIVLRAYRKLLDKFPKMLLIIAPRHPERTSKVEEILEKMGFRDFVRKTILDRGGRRSGAPIIIVDTIGDLARIYSLGTVIFCGGSLVPKGGQNILEPAVWGKVVFYGPSMEDFLDAKEFLEGVSAGIEVRDASQLVKTGIELLENPEELRRRGEAARKLVLANRGSAQRNAQLAGELLEEG